MLFGFGGATYITSGNSVLTSLLSGLKGFLFHVRPRAGEGSAAGGGFSVSFSVPRDMRSIRHGDEGVQGWSVQKASPGASQHGPVEFWSKDVFFTIGITCRLKTSSWAASRLQ